MSLYVDIEKKLGAFTLRAKFEAGEETLALLGASGCGKSMTLKCIAGIEKPDKGKIVVDGVTLFDSEKKINLSPQKRRTGLMFQNYALFPNMTVLQNIQAGAQRERDKKKRHTAVETVLESFGLKEHLHHYPHQLSGGQQQRVALARILVSSPRILLLDEPFSALDSHLRFQLEQEVRQVIGKFGKTVVLVSHDREEVFRMSQRIAVMDGGKIQTIGEKQDVFTAPKTVQAARLTGCKNISRIEALPGGSVRAMDWGIELRLPNLPKHITAIGIRATELQDGKGENAFPCVVLEEIHNPFSKSLLLRCVGRDDALPLLWETEKNYKQGEKVEIFLPEKAILPLEDIV